MVQVLAELTRSRGSSPRYPMVLDALFRLGVGDVVRQLGGYDAGLDDRDADVGQDFLAERF